MADLIWTLARLLIWLIFAAVVLIQWGPLCGIGVVCAYGVLEIALRTERGER